MASQHTRALRVLWCVRLIPELTLVLLPGLDGTGNMFRGFKQALPADLNTVTVAYPPDRVVTMSALVDVVKKHCPSDAPFVLLAESFSTPIALQFASHNSGNLVGVILCAGFATSPLRAWQSMF